jgi:septal ring factor EnvC (AmiA/AmiB activator)
MGEELNYFNYFTEVEDHFQKARGTSLFLMSPIDWALVETWKTSGVPLEAVLRGIDDAFSRKRPKFQQVNSLSYCSQAIKKAAEDMARNRPAKVAPTNEDSLPQDRLHAFLGNNSEALRQKGFAEEADSLAAMAAEVESAHADLEALEQRLTALEERVLARARLQLSEADLVALRRDLEAQLKPHRSRMGAAELALLEKSFLDRQLFEKLGIPRLSLFFLY